MNLLRRRMMFINLNDDNPDKKIFYTTSDGNTITPYSTPIVQDNTVIEHTYQNGEGIIKFRKRVKVLNPGFRNREMLVSITLPSSLTTINGYAFNNCTNLTTLNLLSGALNIGNYAFQYCSNLNKVNISSLIAWCNSTFNQIVSNPLCYGADLFINNTKLTDLVIPNGITKIKAYTFYRCKSITQLSIHKNVNTIEKYVFHECTNITSIVWNPISCTVCNSYSETPFYSIAQNVTSFTFGNEVKSIPRYLCHGMQFSSISIPNSVTSIDYCAFYGCSKIKSLSISKYITSIGIDAFGGCSDLESIIIDTGNSIYDSRDNCNAIIETATNKLICGCKNSIIPATVTTIKSGAFRGSGITSIAIPNNITEIGYEAFANCQSLTYVRIPASVTDLGTHVFMLCSNLTSIEVDSTNTVYDSRNNCNAIIHTASNTLLTGSLNTIIPNNIVRIGEYAFSMQSITSITIPSNVTSIASSAFFGCKQITNIIYGGTMAQWNNMHVDINDDAPVTVVHCSDGDVAI